MIDRLFENIRSKYTDAQFIERYGLGDRLDQTIYEWLDSDVMKLHPDVIGQTLYIIKHECDWPPTISEFMRCSKNVKIDGVPSLEEAYNQAAMGENLSEKHIVVRVAAKETGVYDLRRYPRSKIFNRFSYNYEQAFSRWLKNEDLMKEFRKGLEFKEDSEPVTKKQAEQEREKFRSLKNTLLGGT